MSFHHLQLGSCTPLQSGPHVLKPLNQSLQTLTGAKVLCISCTSTTACAAAAAAVWDADAVHPDPKKLVTACSLHMRLTAASSHEVLHTSHPIFPHAECRQ